MAKSFGDVLMGEITPFQKEVNELPKRNTVQLTGEILSIINSMLVENGIVAQFTAKVFKETETSVTINFIPIDDASQDAIFKGQVGTFEEGTSATVEDPKRILDKIKSKINENYGRYVRINWELKRK